MPCSYGGRATLRWWCLVPSLLLPVCHASGGRGKRNRKPRAVAPAQMDLIAHLAHRPLDYCSVRIRRISRSEGCRNVRVFYRISAEDGRAELEDRPRAKRHLRRIVGLTRPVAGVLRRAHAPEPAPRGTLSIGVEANALTDRKLLPEVKTTF